MSAANYPHLPTEAKIKAERTLLGAMLRDCHLMPQVIAGLNVVALAQASNGMGAVFTEIIAQFQDKGRYTVTTIGRKVASRELLQIASEDTDVDLPMALDWWWLEYSKWAQIEAFNAGIEAYRGDFLSMRAASDAKGAELGLNWTPGNATDWRESFAKWGKDKMEGTEPVYKTKCSIGAVTDILKAFKPGYMTIIAARPGMGKTQWALNLLSDFTKAGANGLFVSLEMTAEDLGRRLLGIRHGINPEATWQCLHHATIDQAIAEVAGMPINVVDNIFGISEIESACIAYHHQKPLEYIFVDYMQMIVPANVKGRNREQDVSSVSGTLTRLSKRLNCPVIVLSQLSRAVEIRGGSKRPQLSDLRDSGSLEQDAANVIFLYRPEYYQILEDAEGKSLKGTGEIIIAKQRNGSTATAYVAYDSSGIRGYRDLPGQPKVEYIAPENSENPDPPF